MTQAVGGDTEKRPRTTSEEMAMPLKNERTAVEPTRWIAALDRMEAALIQIRVASEAKDPPATPVVIMNAEEADDPWPRGIAALLAKFGPEP